MRGLFHFGTTSPAQPLVIDLAMFMRDIGRQHRHLKGLLTIPEDGLGTFATKARLPRFPARERDFLGNHHVTRGLRGADQVALDLFGQAPPWRNRSRTAIFHRYRSELMPAGDHLDMRFHPCDTLRRAIQYVERER